MTVISAFSLEANPSECGFEEGVNYCYITEYEVESEGWTQALQNCKRFATMREVLERILNEDQLRLVAVASSSMREGVQQVDKVLVLQLIDVN